MSKKRVVVAAEVFSSNLGDYAIYESLSTLLALKNVEAIPLDLSFRSDFPTPFNSKTTSIRSNIKVLIPKKIKHHKYTQYILSRTKWYLVQRKNIINEWSELISHCDAVIIGGGQLLTDTSANFHTKIALITNIANNFNKPICIVGCGVGNDLSRKAKKNLTKVLNSAKYIALRDSQSADRLKPFVNEHSSLKISPDLAFALNLLPKTYTAPKKSKLNKMVCGFNIMPLSAFKKYNPNLKDVNNSMYIEFWKRLAHEANKENLQIHIMTNGSFEDYVQAESIYKSMLSEDFDVILADRPISPLDLYDQISNVDYLITARMHAGIVGRVYGKSVTTLIWDDKIPAVWQEAGNEQVAISSNIILDPDPWMKVKSSFSASERISLPDLNKKILTSLDDCLEIVYS